MEKFSELVDAVEVNYWRNQVGLNRLIFIDEEEGCFE